MISEIFTNREESQSKGQLQMPTCTMPSVCNGHLQNCRIDSPFTVK